MSGIVFTTIPTFRNANELETSSCLLGFKIMNNLVSVEASKLKCSKPSFVSLFPLRFALRLVYIFKAFVVANEISGMYINIAVVLGSVT